MRSNTQYLMPRKLKVFKQDEARIDFERAAYGLYASNQNH